MYRPLPLATHYECDLDHNPYAETGQPRHCGSKVFFRSELDGEKVHDYFIQDARGAFGSLITSASALLNVFREFCREDAGDEDCYAQPKLVRAQVAAKMAFSRTGSQAFASTVPLLRDTLTGYLNQLTPGGAPLCFRLRHALLAELQDTQKPKQFAQCVPSVVFEDLESWMHTGCREFSPFQRSQPEHVADFLLFVSHPGQRAFEHVQHQPLRAALCAADAALRPERAHATGGDISRMYCNAALAGTQLHSYLEMRLGGSAPAEAARAAQCWDPLDCAQAEAFIGTLDAAEPFQHLELTLASYRHKICGSIDAVQRLRDGTLRVHDYKRTPKFSEEPWFKLKRVSRPLLSEVELSNPLCAYAVQLAVYRKLLLLNRVGDVDQEARLVIFHPLLPRACIIAIDLSQPMKTDTKGYFKGIGTERFGKRALTLSPIDLVELLFDWHESQVKSVLRH